MTAGHSAARMMHRSVETTSQDPGEGLSRGPSPGSGCRLEVLDDLIDLPLDLLGPSILHALYKLLEKALELKVAHAHVVHAFVLSVIGVIKSGY